MHIENFQPGDVITVLNGRKHHCPAGCCVIGEAYEDCKGRPLLILAVDPPYIVTANVVGLGGRVLDGRYCELTKCSPEYLSAFRQMLATPADCCLPETLKVRIVDGPGDAQPVE